MRFRLRTLLIVLALAPLAIAATREQWLPVIWAAIPASLRPFDHSGAYLVTSPVDGQLPKSAHNFQDAGQHLSIDEPGAEDEGNSRGKGEFAK
jgi:hypothetical protein